MPMTNGIKKDITKAASVGKTKIGKYRLKDLRMNASPRRTKRHKFNPENNSSVTHGVVGPLQPFYLCFNL